MEFQQVLTKIANKGRQADIIPKNIEIMDVATTCSMTAITLLSSAGQEQRTCPIMRGVRKFETRRWIVVLHWSCLGA